MYNFFFARRFFYSTNRKILQKPELLSDIVWRIAVNADWLVSVLFVKTYHFQRRFVEKHLARPLARRRPQWDINRRICSLKQVSILLLRQGGLVANLAREFLPLFKGREECTKQMTIKVNGL